MHVKNKIQSQQSQQSHQNEIKEIETNENEFIIYALLPTRNTNELLQTDNNNNNNKFLF